VRVLRLCAILLTAAYVFRRQDSKNLKRKSPSHPFQPECTHRRERHEAPVGPHSTRNVNAGRWTIRRVKRHAHMFEHMASRHETIGTRDWRARRKPWTPSRKVIRPLEGERNKGPKPTRPGSVCCSAVEGGHRRAEAYVVPNDYLRIIETNGARG